MNNNLKTLTSVGIFVLALVTGQNAFGFSGGVTGYSSNPATNAGNSCLLCHSGGAAPTVNLSGPISVQPGTINTYTLTISGGQANSGGLGVSADAGTLINTLASTRLQANEITHSSRATADANGDVSWSFNWQAPTALGTYTLYSAGLSTNADGNTTGDNVGNMALAVTVSAGAAEPPTAAIQAPLTAEVNTTVSFDGTASFDPDGVINQYAWDFGDGNTASGAQTINTYTAAGVYTVTLTVTDSDNLSDTTFRDITIGATMVPVADPGGPYTVTEGQPLTLDGSQSTHVSPITNYIWDFGDGTPVENYAVPTVSHTYSAPGAYTVTLAVQDASNITGVASTIVVVEAVVPPPPPPELDGPTLYGNNCAACHGALDSSSKLNRSAIQIQIAIDSNTGGMGGLSGLSPAQVQAIADALVSTTPPPPPPTDGPTLYANNCMACHGDLANSAKLNRTATQIQAAIDANTGGMGGLSGLTPTEVQAIADALVTATPPPPPPTDGPTLYANNCMACHGDLASSSKLNRTATQIQAAIDANTGGMGGLSGLTPTEVQSIADALVSTTPPPPPPTDGQSLYTNNCAACHGPLATSSKLNRSATQIQAAIDANTGGMGGLNGLDPTQVQAIADALVSVTPPPAPTTGEGLYNSYCLVCHGPGGTGGQYEAVTGDSANDIASAISGEPLMNSISLSSGQLQDIADYLSGATPPPAPVTGQDLYNNYCLACHGPGGTGGIYEAVNGESASSIADAIDEESLMNSISLNSSQLEDIADYLSGEGGCGGGGCGGTPPPPAPTDGATLYGNSCAGCHGALASSSKLNRTASQIQAAIDANTGGMGGLSGLTPTNVQAIADALATGGGGGGTPPPPAPTDGATLYTNNCSGCHGALASSSKTGRSAAQIQSAIDANTGGMGGLSTLTATEVQAISDALAGGGTTPLPTTGEGLYISYCQSCHGFNGTGGSGGAVVGASSSNINSALSSVGQMQGITLSGTDVQAIADFLSSGGGTQPQPTTGEEIYAVKCAACHGPGGTGGSEEAVTGVTVNEIQDAMQNVSEMQSIPLTNGEAQALESYLSGGESGGDGYSGYGGYGGHGGHGGHD